MDLGEEQVFMDLGGVNSVDCFMCAFSILKDSGLKVADGETPEVKRGR
jgi:hypothetical protein